VLGSGGTQVQVQGMNILKLRPSILIGFSCIHSALMNSAGRGEHAGNNTFSAIASNAGNVPAGLYIMSHSGQVTVTLRGCLKAFAVLPSMFKPVQDTTPDHNNLTNTYTH
jgi:hypothetical protein